jgi:NADPH-dependent glutamate synthase beta subunit-like oxidoreductase
MLFYGLAEEKLPKEILLAEIDIIRQLGVRFQLNTEMGKHISFKEMTDEFDVLALATGKLDFAEISAMGIETTARGIKVAPHTFQTSQAKIFAGGNAVSEGRMAIKSVAHGKAIAVSINQFLTGEKLTGIEQRFDSHLGRLQNGELEEYLKEAKQIPQQIPVKTKAGGLTIEKAINEAERCWHCDCRKPDSCQLRLYADEYQAQQQKYKAKNRKKFERIVQHAQVIYEPGKCIKCGLCVRITQRAGEKFGFTFIGRGFDVRLGVPLHESLENGLKKVAAECVKACPTAALAFSNRDYGADDQNLPR